MEPKTKAMIRVLVVDDSPLMCKILTNIMNCDPHIMVVAVASNGREAVDFVPRLKPDLITMDIVMPVMDGLAALREIVRLDPAARVVMVSALGQEALIADAIDAGARDFIVKPFQPDRVLRVVQSVLGLDEAFRPVGVRGRPEAPHELAQ